ncbi:hypothetical protein O9992_28565 [Vibrio lentus]|nr:hypothetical protein [Vibrio lentus]
MSLVEHQKLITALCPLRETKKVEGTATHKIASQFLRVPAPPTLQKDIITSTFGADALQPINFLGIIPFYVSPVKRPTLFKFMIIFWQCVLIVHLFQIVAARIKVRYENLNGYTEL